MHSDLCILNPCIFVNAKTFTTRKFLQNKQMCTSQLVEPWRALLIAELEVQTPLTSIFFKIKKPYCLLAPNGWKGLH